LWFLPLLIIALLLSGLHQPTVAFSDVKPDTDWTALDEYGFVYSINDGEIVCRPTTSIETPFLFANDPNLELKVISRGEVAPQAGSDITFVLRGTDQLEANQQAKAVFLRAAEIWRNQLQSPIPITIIIDVDFGTTFFGQLFNENVLGATRPQELSSSTGYPSVRSALINGSETAEEANLYNLLPSSMLPTSAGNLEGLTLPSALLRALGLIAPEASPGTEPGFGNPPRIGFNSAFSFDFDPTDGISPNSIDFEAVAVHEIGHLLGFFSRVGSGESGFTQTASVFDFFRFRPGVTLETFNTSERILASGGQQVFFAGGSELQVSTGRPDGSGGDGRQASHWKDDVFVGNPIGIMDPTIAFGARGVIGPNDLFALDAMGYRLRGNPGEEPAIGSADGNLSGDVLTITGIVSDAQADITQVQVSLLATNGNVLRQDAPAPISFGGAITASFTVEVEGLITVPAATRAQIAFRDTDGNTSDSVTVDFGKADAGGPTLKNANLNGSKLIIKGSGLKGQMLVEINGVAVASGNSKKNKIKLPGGRAANNLNSGPNRIRVTINGLRSNIVVLNLS